MKIAVIADIHGNLAALEAVLADLDRHRVDMVVNLGDLLSGPLQPAETANRLMELNVPTLAGNHERQLLTLNLDQMGASDSYTHSCLAERHRAWLATLPTTLWIDRDVFLCHGTPDSDLTYFLETVEPSGAREASDGDVEARAGNVQAALILCGHTHIARSRKISGERLVVNPGSVGLPAYEDDRPFSHVMEAGSPNARYAICSRDSAGHWEAKLTSITYDWEAAAHLADQRGRPDWAVALRTGRM